MSEQRSGWEKAAVFMQPVGGLLTALAVAIVGLAGSQMIERQQTKNTDARLYSELMSQREQAESNLRKDMLVSVIQSYLAPDAGSIEARLLQLELLGYNFHDSLNLKPLFLDLQNQIQRTQGRGDLVKRLRRVAREISERQRFALELRGDSFRRTIDLQELTNAGKAGVVLEPASLAVEGVTTEVNLRVLAADPETPQLTVRLEALTGGAENPSATRVEFDVTFFDFPMIDSTRLENGQRCAVILSAFGRQAADVTTVCFPGEYASLKDRPYYDEVVRQLRLRE